MSVHAFEKLEGAKQKKFIDRLNKSWAGSPFDAARTVVHARPLSFANDWILAEAADGTIVPEKRCVALDNGAECVPVQFNAEFIPAFAGKNRVMLDSDSASDYMRFWFEYVRSGADRFMLVEAVDDMPWREEPTPQARKSLAKSVMPLTLVDQQGDVFVFKACMLFRDTLFACTLETTRQGRVSITSRLVIAEGLTVIDSTTGF